MFEVGDRVEFYKTDDETERYIKYMYEIFTIKEVVKSVNGKDEDYAIFEETSEIIPYLKNLRLVGKLNGLALLKEIKKGNIRNCDIKVYKNDKYQFTVKCGEKGILSNPKLHVGMLTSDKYTYEPIRVKEMTISEIEKELGYSIKIIKENKEN